MTTLGYDRYMIIRKRVNSASSCEYAPVRIGYQLCRSRYNNFSNKPRKRENERDCRIQRVDKLIKDKMEVTVAGRRSLLGSAVSHHRTLNASRVDRYNFPRLSSIEKCQRQCGDLATRHTDQQPLYDTPSASRSCRMYSRCQTVT
jgi:hypothetical protein